VDKVQDAARTPVDKSTPAAELSHGQLPSPSTFRYGRRRMGVARPTCPATRKADNYRGGGPSCRTAAMHASPLVEVKGMAQPASR